MPIAIHGSRYELANGIVMSATLGLRKLSPSSTTACTAIATSVASDSASWVTRRSGPRRLSSRPPIIRPTDTDTLENSSAAVPAARLAIQKRCTRRSSVRRARWP